MILKAHKPEMLAAWAKENKVAGWEKIYQAYDPKEREKYRQQNLRFSQRKNSNQKKILNKSEIFPLIVCK